MPTVESVARVVREWHHAFGNEPLYVDVVTPDGDVRDSQEFAQPTIEEVMEFIENEFDRPSMSGSTQMPASLKSFGLELRKLLNSAPVFAILDNGDWGAGGCWVLAQTLVDFLGPPAELIAVSEQRARDFEDIIIPVSHVAVRYVDMYIDYNGAHTEEEFIEHLGLEGYEDPQIQEWDDRRVQEAASLGIPCDPRSRKDLLKHLHRRFGP
jgi:hypothetical protein